MSINCSSLWRFWHVRKMCECSRVGITTGLSPHMLVFQGLVTMNIWILPAKHSKSCHVIPKSEIDRSLYSSLSLIYAIRIEFNYYRPISNTSWPNWTPSTFWPSMVSCAGLQFTEVTFSLILFRFQWESLFQAYLKKILILTYMTDIEYPRLFHPETH